MANRIDNLIPSSAASQRIGRIAIISIIISDTGGGG